MATIERKYVFCMGLLFLTVFCFAYDVSVLNGIWVRKNGYDLVVNNPEDRHLNRLTMLHSSFQIEWDGRKNEGVFRLELEPYRITKLDSMSDEITMTYGLYDKRKMVFKVISCDILQVLSHPYDSIIDILYRIGDPSKPSLTKGVITENRVRFRNKPDLSSGCFYFLEKGEVIEIIGISPEKEKIGNMEEYWYEICIGSGDPNSPLKRGMFYVMGWVYGAYVDVVNKKAFEEKYKSDG